MPGRQANGEHHKTSQDVASLAATVRKVESEQAQIYSAINALSSKFDLLADRISNLGRPNYQAAGFVAAILMAFGGLVWSFVDGTLKENTSQIKELIATEHAEDMDTGKMLGAVDQRMKAADERFELHVVTTTGIDEKYGDRLDAAERDIIRLKTENEYQNLDAAEFRELRENVASIKERIKPQTNN